MTEGKRKRAREREREREPCEKNLRRDKQGWSEILGGWVGDVGFPFVFCEYVLIPLINKRSCFDLSWGTI